MKSLKTLILGEIRNTKLWHRIHKLQQRGRRYISKSSLEIRNKTMIQN